MNKPHQPRPNAWGAIRRVFGRGVQATLNGVEWIGNKFPKPIYLFLFLVIIIIFVSMILSLAVPNGVVLAGLNQDQPVHFFNLIGRDGIIWWLKNFIPNFMALSTTGIVIITTVFVNVAEKAGFVDLVMRKIATAVSRKILTPMMIMIGCLTNLAADAGYLILIPLAGLLYYRAGRHPLAGIAAVFAGVSGGFVTTLLPGTIDVIMTSLTNDILEKQGYQHLSINPMSVYYFTLTLFFLYILVGWALTDLVIEKRLHQRYKFHRPTHIVVGEKVKLTHLQRRGLIAALVFIALYVIVFTLFITVPGAPFSGFIYEIQNIPAGFKVGDYQPLNHLALIIGFLFLGIGITYGFFAQTFKSPQDVVDSLVEGFKKVVPALILFMVMAQFIAALSQSNIGIVSGYYLGIGLTRLSNPLVVLALFVVVVAFFNLMMAGLTSKWGILGPIFLLALAKAGIDPSVTTAAYRVGDSATNLIAPLMAYFPLILMWTKDWVVKEQRASFEMGSLMSIMFPYAVCFLVVGLTTLLVWVAVGTPLGVGSHVYLKPAEEDLAFLAPLSSDWRLAVSAPEIFKLRI